MVVWVVLGRGTECFSRWLVVGGTGVDGFVGAWDRWWGEGVDMGTVAYVCVDAASFVSAVGRGGVGLTGGAFMT